MPGDGVVEEILGVRLQERMMTGTILQPHRRRGQESAERHLGVSFQGNYLQ